MFANSAGTFTAQGDVIYSTGHHEHGRHPDPQRRDDRCRRLRLAERTRRPTARAPGVAQPSSGAGGFARKNGGTQDTDDNVADFNGPLTPTPTKCGETCGGPVGPQPCAADADGIMPITEIQTLGANAACNGRR